MNLLAGLPNVPPASESIADVLDVPPVRIERIVSYGHNTDWYDQDEDEWVAVLTGSGILEFADGALRELRPGDHLHIPAHCRHRVASTVADRPTVWLAVFFRALHE